MTCYCFFLFLHPVLHFIPHQSHQQNSGGHGGVLTKQGRMKGRDLQEAGRIQLLCALAVPGEGGLVIGVIGSGVPCPGGPPPQEGLPDPASYIKRSRCPEASMECNENGVEEEKFSKIIKSIKNTNPQR